MSHSVPGTSLRPVILDALPEQPADGDGLSRPAPSRPRSPHRAPSWLHAAVTHRPPAGGGSPGAVAARASASPSPARVDRATDASPSRRPTGRKRRCPGRSFGSRRGPGGAGHGVRQTPPAPAGPSRSEQKPQMQQPAVLRVAVEAERRQQPAQLPAVVDPRGERPFVGLPTRRAGRPPVEQVVAPQRVAGRRRRAPARRHRERQARAPRAVADAQGSARRRARGNLPPRAAPAAGPCLDAEHTARHPQSTDHFEAGAGLPRPVCTHPRGAVPAAARRRTTRSGVPLSDDAFPGLALAGADGASAPGAGHEAARDRRLARPPAWRERPRKLCGQKDTPTADGARTRRGPGGLLRGFLSALGPRGCHPLRNRLLLFGRHRSALPRRLGVGRGLRDRGGRSRRTHPSALDRNRAMSR